MMLPNVGLEPHKTVVLKLKLLDNMKEIAHSETKLVLRQREESGGTLHRKTKNDVAECGESPTAVCVDH